MLWSALDSLEFTDAIYLLHERGKAMQKAVPIGKGMMIAVLGANIDEINELLDSNRKNEGICEIANDNAEGQIILSGNVESVKSIQQTLKEKNKIYTS